MINKPFLELVMVVVSADILGKNTKTLLVPKILLFNVGKTTSKKQYVWLHKSRVVKQEDSASFCEYQQ